MQQKKFFFKFSYFATWGTHLPNYEFWGPPQRPTTLFCGKTSLEKMDTYKQNIRILGAQRLRRISSHDVRVCVVCVCTSVTFFGRRII